MELIARIGLLIATIINIGLFIYFFKFQKEKEKWHQMMRKLEVGSDNKLQFSEIPSTIIKKKPIVMDDEKAFNLEMEERLKRKPTF